VLAKSGNFSNGMIDTIKVYYDSELVSEIDVDAYLYDDEVGPYDATPGGDYDPGPHIVRVTMLLTRSSHAPSREMSFTIEPDSAPPERENQNIDQAAAAYYAQRYGVSEIEALHRVRFQDDVSRVADEVSDALGDDYAGLWYNHTDEGRLQMVVRSQAGFASQAEPSGPGVDEAKAILAERGLLDRTDVVAGGWSRSELTAGSEALVDRLGDVLSRSRIEIGVSTSMNALYVEYSADITTEDLARVTQAADQSAVPVDVRSTGSPFDPVDSMACNRSAAVIEDVAQMGCDRPLRGGMSIASDIGEQGLLCTAGFPVTSQTDDRRYLLTAGHCLEDTPSTEGWAGLSAGGKFRLLGGRHSFHNGREGDVGLIAVEPDSFWWRRRGWVVVDPQGEGDMATTQNDAYRIRRVSIAQEGQILCATTGPARDNGKHTDCGTYEGGDRTRDVGGTTVGHLGRVVDICIGQGASGGPVYKMGTAHGISVGGDGPAFGCHLYYQGASRAQALLNVNVLKSG
jgi:hypothetical protein